ncbi:MAG: peptidylprolyl isomerase [Oscillospiraceae bacterium]|nr:peptidylprolyl isomerase [Oscillospiraceae bacterium]
MKKRIISALLLVALIAAALVSCKGKGSGTIVIELDPAAAPVTVANFLKLVNSGFYDGLTFHRVVPGFMIQGGDPQGTGMGGSDENIFGEFAANGWTQNTISHERGVISMARSQAPDSASSQFFITNDNAAFLDGNYAAFGRVTKGLDVLDAISAVKTDLSEQGKGGKPLSPVKIKTIKEITKSGGAPTIEITMEKIK